MIRVATVSDEFDALAGEAGIPGVVTDRVRIIVNAAVEAGECLVAVASNGEVEGFVVTTVRSFFARDFVRLLAVSPRHRRSGIGSALLAAAIHRATTDVVFISTNESNSAMRALLVRDGWTYSGTLTGIDEGDPEIVFWREKTTSLEDDDASSLTR